MAVKPTSRVRDSWRLHLGTLSYTPVMFNKKDWEVFVGTFLVTGVQTLFKYLNPPMCYRLYYT